MSAQLNYGFSTPVGIAGGIVDLAPHAIDTFLNEEATGTLKFGMGVVKGTKAGTEVKMPKTGATAADFEGVTVNNRSTEYDLDGKIRIVKGAAVGVMKYGRVWVRLAANITPAHNDALYLVISGDDAGCFTNVSGASAVAVKGRFIGASGNGIAQAELFNQAQ